MKEEMMNADTLSRPELLTLLSILEGELEAQDVVVHAIRAQHRDSFVQERYGQYDLSDPFLALQRDSEGVERQLKRAGTHAHPDAPVGPNPLAVLKLVMAHCKRMQERMMGQLAAAESRHRRVITDLEGEKQRHALVAAQGDDVTLMLKTEREKLLQQLEVERAALRRLEKEQARVAGQAEESLSHQQELSSDLRLQLQRASDQAQEEAQRAAQLHSRLQAESAMVESLRGALEAEKGRAGQLEAMSEKQQAEFDTQREQMKAKLSREEEKNRELRREVQELGRRLGGSAGGEKEGREEVKEPPSKVAGASGVELVSTSSQTEGDGKAFAVSRVASVSKANGHHPSREAETRENGDAAPQPSPFPPPSHPQSPSSTASSSLSSSPISSPVLAKRLVSPVFHQSSYQAGVNQRFHAARYRFQSQAELEQHQQGGSAPLSPRDLSPTTTPVPPSPENSAAKQLARNTVTQVLSRFTSQQAGAKLAPLSSSPFGTDYRSLASPPGGRSPSSSPLSPGIRSPLTPRSEKHQPPALFPKKQGMSPTPASPGSSARTSLFPELTGGCGLSSNGQEDATEADLVFSSGS